MGQGEALPSRAEVEVVTERGGTPAASGSALRARFPGSLERRGEGGGSGKRGDLGGGEKEGREQGAWREEGVGREEGGGGRDRVEGRGVEGE